MSQLPTKKISGWNEAKQQRLKDVAPPEHDGMKYLHCQPFEALSGIFKVQQEGSSRLFGAAHVGFSEQVRSDVGMTLGEFTTFKDVKHYEWKELQPGIYSNTLSEKEHGTNGIARLLLERNLPKPVEIKHLSPESTLEQLEKFMRDCKGSYTIGTEGRAITSAKLVELGPFNFFTMNDFLLTRDSAEYSSLNGLASPWAITGPRLSVTPLHAEDKMFASVNINVYGGPKIWIVIDADAENVNNLNVKVKEATQKRRNGAFCAAWHRDRTRAFSPRILTEWGIRFCVIFQEFGQIVVTESYGLHETINVMNNISIARNIVYSRTPQVFDEHFLSCTCRKHSNAKPLKFSEQQYYQWVQADLQNMADSKKKYQQADGMEAYTLPLDKKAVIQAIAYFNCTIAKEVNSDESHVADLHRLLLLLKMGERPSPYQTWKQFIRKYRHRLSMFAVTNPYNIKNKQASKSKYGQKTMRTHQGNSQKYART